MPKAQDMSKTSLGKIKDLSQKVWPYVSGYSQERCSDNHRVKQHIRDCRLHSSISLFAASRLVSNEVAEQLHGSVMHMARRSRP